MGSSASRNSDPYKANYQNSASLSQNAGNNDSNEEEEINNTNQTRMSFFPPQNNRTMPKTQINANNPQPNDNVLGKYQASDVSPVLKLEKPDISGPKYNPKTLASMIANNYKNIDPSNLVAESEKSEEEKQDDEDEEETKDNLQQPSNLNHQNPPMQQSQLTHQPFPNEYPSNLNYPQNISPESQGEDDDYEYYSEEEDDPPRSNINPPLGNMQHVQAMPNQSEITSPRYVSFPANVVKENNSLNNSQRLDDPKQISNNLQHPNYLSQQPPINNATQPQGFNPLQNMATQNKMPQTVAPQQMHPNNQEPNNQNQPQNHKARPNNISVHNTQPQSLQNAPTSREIPGNESPTTPESPSDYRFPMPKKDSNPPKNNNPIHPKLIPNQIQRNQTVPNPDIPKQVIPNQNIPVAQTNPNPVPIVNNYHPPKNAEPSSYILQPKEIEPEPRPTHPVQYFNKQPETQPNKPPLGLQPVPPSNSRPNPLNIQPRFQRSAIVQSLPQQNPNSVPKVNSSQEQPSHEKLPVHNPIPVYSNPPTNKSIDVPSVQPLKRSVDVPFENYNTQPVNNKFQTPIKPIQDLKLHQPISGTSSNAEFYNPRHHPDSQREVGSLLPPLIINPRESATPIKLQSTPKSINHPLTLKPSSSRPQSPNYGLRELPSRRSEIGSIRSRSTGPTRPGQIPTIDRSTPISINSSNRGTPSASLLNSRTIEPNTPTQIHKSRLPPDALESILQNPAYQSVEMGSIKFGSSNWQNSPRQGKQPRTIDPAKSEINVNAASTPYSYNQASRKELYDKNGMLPYKTPIRGRGEKANNLSFDESKDGSRRPIINSAPYMNVKDGRAGVHASIHSQSYIKPLMERPSELKPVNPRLPNNENFDDLSYSVQGTMAKRFRGDQVNPNDASFNEFNSRFDNLNDKITMSKIGSSRGDSNSQLFSNVFSKPEYRGMQLMFEKSNTNPMLKGDMTPASSSRSKTPLDLSSSRKKAYDAPNFDTYHQPSFQRMQVEQPDYKLKIQANDPTNKNPHAGKEFDFGTCINYLTGDDTLEHLKGGHPLEFVFVKARIPGDKMKARVIKKIFELNLERTEYIKQPIHIRLIAYKFLNSAKVSLKEPLFYLEDIANDQDPPRTDLQDLLEGMLEFFHFLGFFLQHEKFFNYYDRWWSTPRDEDYIEKLADRIEQIAKDLKQDTNDVMWRKKMKEENESRLWSYTRVWGAREVKVLSTARRYLKYLFDQSVRKKKKLTGGA